MTNAEAAIAYYEGWSELAALPGFPFFPCPICRGTEGCDHTGYERARAAHPGLSLPMMADKPN